MILDRKLPLTSSRWCELRCADGDGSDLPRRIRALEVQWNAGLAPKLELPPPTDDPWLAIFLAIQGHDGVEEAAYAVVPHLVELASEHSTSRKADVVGMVVTLTFHYRHAPLPVDLRAGYEQGIAAMASLAEDVLATDQRPRVIDIAIAGLFVALGNRRAAALANAIADRSIRVDCAACHASLTIEFEDDVWRLGPTSGGGQVRALASAIPPRHDVCALVAQVGAASHPMSHVADLESLVPCPKCGHEVDLFSALAKRIPELKPDDSPPD